MIPDSNPNGLCTDASLKSLVSGDSQAVSVKSAMEPAVPHKMGRQRGEGSLPVGNSKSKNETRRNHPIPRAHAPNHPAQAPAGSAPASVKRAYTPYSSVSSPPIQTRAPERKSQPMAFSGRRE